MTGLRIVHVTSIPGAIGSPTALPAAATSSGLAHVQSRAGVRVVARATRSAPSAHWCSRKYCVGVSAMNFSISVLEIELSPEFSGISGRPLSANSCWCCGASSGALVARRRGS